MYSYWEKAYWHDHYDVAIIGAGIVGLTTAYYLHQSRPGWRIIVLERGALPYGASTRNAGFACFGTAGELLDDLEKLSPEEVTRLVQLRWEGLQKLTSLHDLEEIGYRQKGGYELFDDPDDFERCADSLDRVNEIMLEATGKTQVLRPGKQDFFSGFYGTAIYNPLEGELNPVMLVRSLISKLQSPNITLAFGMKADSISGNEGAYHISIHRYPGLECRQIALCTNAFSGQFASLDLQPARNQVMVSEPLKGRIMEGDFHLDRGYVYFRMVDGRLLIGGARNLDAETELTDQFGPNNRITDVLSSIANEKILGYPVTFPYSWSGIIATGSSRFPILRKSDDGIILAVRLGGMGVAIGSELASQAAAMILSGSSY